jgi:hypothetical protein
MPAAVQANRWRVREGEEARLTPGSAFAAEIWSRGFLPLRARTEGSHHARPGFPGTAVVLGGETYEVLSETELPEDGLVVYRMRTWPDGEVTRDRVSYGAAFVRAAEAARERDRDRERARPFRAFLYPLVGLLPEEEQDRACDRLGLSAVAATLTSGLAESACVLLAVWVVAHGAEAGHTPALLGPLVLLVLPGLARAAAAALFHETAGSPALVLPLRVWRALGRTHVGERALLPLSRAAFWERLGRPDDVRAGPDGAYVFSGVLPHLTWDRARRLQSRDAFWQVEPEPPAFDRGRLVFAYRITPLGDAGGCAPPPPGAYADEVLEEVRREWDGWNKGFLWLTSLLGEDAQQRAFAQRGGPAAVRRATLLTAAASALLGAYLLSFLPGPKGDPLAPFAGLGGALLLLDAARRIGRARAARYAPSLFRFLLPSQVLRPERLAYHAHRDAERLALSALRGR